MKITKRSESHICVLTLDGVLDEHSELPSEAAAVLDDGFRGVLINLSGVPMITSAGLSQLVQLTARANTQRVPLALAGPTPFVQGVLETTRLIKFFEVHETVEAGVAALLEKVSN